MAAPVTLDQELELRIDSLAYGGNGVARLDGFVVFVRRGLPGRSRPRARDEGEAKPRRGARPSTCSSPARRASTRRAPLPGLRRLPLPGSRLRGADRGEGGAGRDALQRIGGSPTCRSSRSSRPSRRSTTATSSSTRSRRTPDGPDAGPAPGGSLGRGAADRALLARRPTSATRSATPSATGRARSGSAPTTRRRTGLPPPPRRPRGPQHRPGARLLVTAPGERRARSTSSTSSAASPRCARSTGRSTTGRPR